MSHEDAPRVLEVSTAEPEGWPLDGGTVTTLRRYPDGRLELEHDTRHLDADGPRVEARAIAPDEAAAWLREQDPLLLRVEEMLPELLAAAETLTAEGGPPEVDGGAQAFVRRLSPGLFFLESRRSTTEREVDAAEVMLEYELPWVGAVVRWVKDRVHDLQGEQAPRLEVHRRWLAGDELRRSLEAAGIDPARVDELLG